jgi:hypothetical protein
MAELWVQSMKLALCHHFGTSNLKACLIFLENLWTPGLDTAMTEVCYFCSVVLEGIICTFVICDMQGYRLVSVWPQNIGNFHVICLWS